MFVLRKVKLIIKDVLVIALLLAICIVLFVFLKAQNQLNGSDYAKKEVIENEILRRADVIVEQGEIINLFELTPFIWDTSVSYFGYFGQDNFDQLTMDLNHNIPYYEMNEVGQRKIFIHNNDLVFDALGKASIDWYIYDDPQRWQNAYRIDIQNTWYRYEGDGVLILIEEGELNDCQGD